MGIREILFRGKYVDDDVDNGEWVYGSLLYSGSEDQYYIVENDGEELSYPVSKETIGQYTGLEDKNSTKIFEGDIVLADFEYKDERMEVIFYQCGFKLKSKNCEYYYDYSIHDESADLEVIGNVFDNHELLEKVEEENGKINQN